MEEIHVVFIETMVCAASTALIDQSQKESSKIISRKNCLKNHHPNKFQDNGFSKYYI